MQKLLLIAVAGLMLASCSTTKKSKSISKATIDSISQVDKNTAEISKYDSTGTTIKKDTSTITEVGHVETITETGWDKITIDSGDVITFPTSADDYFPPVITKPNGKKEIYLPKKRETKTEKTEKTEAKGSSTETTSQVNKSDSSADQEKITTAVKKTEITKDKKVSKSRPSWLLYLGLLILLLLLLGYRYRKRLKALIWPSSALNNS